LVVEVAGPVIRQLQVVVQVEVQPTQPLVQVALICREIPEELDAPTPGLAVVLAALAALVILHHLQTMVAQVVPGFRQQLVAACKPSLAVAAVRAKALVALGALELEERADRVLQPRAVRVSQEQLLAAVEEEEALARLTLREARAFQV
jgi:hypothetical protein